MKNALITAVDELDQIQAKLNYVNHVSPSVLSDTALTGLYALLDEIESSVKSVSNRLTQQVRIMCPDSEAVKLASL